MTRFVESTITFPYKRSLGPVVGAFMTALTEKRILGIRNGDAVLVPPMEWDPATGAELAHDFVEVGPAGTVESWTWVPDAVRAAPARPPVRLRLHPPRRRHHAAAPRGRRRLARPRWPTGMRVAPRWKGTRVGRIDDIACFVPGEDAETEGDDTGPAAEPVTRMDYLASITYRNPVPASADRAVDASQRAPAARARAARPAGGCTPAGGGYCPIDALELGPEREVDLPQTGTITNFAVVTPVQYPGQTETEPFARVFVLLDGTDVILTYSAGDRPAGRRGARRPAGRARCGPRRPSEIDDGGGMGGAFGDLLGWMPNGEPDVDDPDLVNRIF